LDDAACAGPERPTKPIADAARATAAAADRNFKLGMHLKALIKSSLLAGIAELSH
jgi:hypothetical protein